ncbi:MAG TPA: energy-coupling factor transporter transmembrane component T [Haploplasma sp.]|nr:energy-coupling factor transporter transmembrane component T [Haploplasma sp.]
MNNKISIGQYVPTNSWLHRLDPRIKIFGLVVMLISVFLIPISGDIKSTVGIINLSMLGLMLLFSIILNISAKVPIKKMIAGVRPLVFLLTFTFVIQLFTIKSGTPVFGELTMNVSVLTILAVVGLLVLYNFTKKILPFRTLYFFLIVFMIFFVQYIIRLDFGLITTYNFAPTDEGIIRGIFLFVRIMITVMFTTLLTFSTMTTDLNFGFEYLLSPLKLIKVPVDVLSMMLALILRFIPTLLFETEKIMKAQASRGLDFKESKLREKVTQVIALLVPIFLISITRAEDLSDAMEARGYIIGNKRSRIDEFKINYVDILTLVITLIIIGSIITVKVIF